jgi:hypothetical protein
MITPIPSVEVWQSKSDPQQILVLHKGASFDRHEGRPFYSGNVTVGKIGRHTLNDFASGGFDVIRKSLADFPSRTQTEPCPPSELDSMAKKAKRALFAAHRLVTMSPENGILRLNPMHHKVVGVKGSGKASETRYVPIDASPEEFMRALQECFDRAD